MDKIYQILSLLKDEFQCYDVAINLSQCYEDKGDEVGYESFHITLYSNLCNVPLELEITTDTEKLKNVSVRSVCDNLKFELSCASQMLSDEFYEFSSASKRVH